MTNSADPDQLASKPSVLDLHCFQRQGISGSAGQGLSKDMKKWQNSLAYHIWLLRVASMQIYNNNLIK